MIEETVGRPEIALIAEPGIEIELPAEIGEAVIAHHQDRGAAVVAGEDLAHHGVELLRTAGGRGRSPLRTWAADLVGCFSSESHHNMCACRSVLEK